MQRADLGAVQQCVVGVPSCRHGVIGEHDRDCVQPWICRVDTTEDGRGHFTAGHFLGPHCGGHTGCVPAPNLVAHRCSFAQVDQIATLRFDPPPTWRAELSNEIGVDRVPLFAVMPVLCDVTIVFGASQHGDSAGRSFDDGRARRRRAGPD